MRYYFFPVIVADSNVFLSGCRSPNGASFVVLRGMLTGEITFAATPAMLLEYEDVLKRPVILGRTPAVPPWQIDPLLEALCENAVQTFPWFRFRPFLLDPKDDLFIECALAAGARLIVSGDRHFQNPAVSAFGLTVTTARDFVANLRQERKKS